MQITHPTPILKLSDLQVGDTIETESRTILASDVHSFCGLVGDTNPIHLSDVAAKGTPYGDVLVPATLTMAMTIALLGSTRWLHAVLMPFVGMTEMKVEGPVFPRDTIMAKVTVTNKRLTSDGRRHVLELRMETFAECVGRGSEQVAREKRLVLTFFQKFMAQDPEAM